MFVRDNDRTRCCFVGIMIYDCDYLSDLDQQLGGELDLSAIIYSTIIHISAIKDSSISIKYYKFTTLITINNSA